MKYNDSLILKSQQITKQVLDAEKMNKPIDHLVKQQIEIMEAHHDEFVRQADNEGIDNLQKAKIEIQLYSNIKAWANKIGLSTEKYDKAIHDIRAKFFGEENTKKFFET